MIPTVTIIVREHARLTTASVAATLDQAQVSQSAFDWLCELAAGFRRSGASLLEVHNRCWLKLGGYVGVIETPCGTRLEILPKHVDNTCEDVACQARTLLRSMLLSALNLPSREADEAGLETFEHPVTEWVMSRFLQALQHVVRRGVRRDYVRVESVERYLRGQLDVGRHLRLAPGREHLFPIRHDVYEPDRPENRLLKSALLVVCARSQTVANWRLSHELASLLAEVPASRDIQADFRAWSKDRLMAHYQPARPWCELVLGHEMPLALAGGTRGLSLLFPMERLFERHVAANLRAMLPAGYRVREQSTLKSLCEHRGEPFFRLKPDLFVEGPGQAVILDAKWKRLNGSARGDNYGIAQSDFYQLYAYGQKYLGGEGELALIYPQTATFFEPLAPFEFSCALKLHVLPFNLETSTLCLPPSLAKFEVCKAVS